MSLKFFKKVLTLAIPFLVILSIGLASYLRVLDYYELGSLDLRFVLRYPKIPTSDKIVYIEVGEDSIEKLGRFPFDRNYHAILVKALSEHKAKMVLFDFLFSEPEEHDNEFRYSLNQAGCVYLPFAFNVETRGNKITKVWGYTAKCLDDLTKEAKGTGHINIVPDEDGKFRRIPVFINYEDTFYPYVSFLMACDYLGLPIHKLKVPMDEDGNLMVNFAGKWGSSYKHYSYVDVIKAYFDEISGQKPSVDLDDFKDKICIIGLTAAGTSDIHPNPFETIYPGMGIHGEVINSILNRNFIRRASRAVNLAILFILGLLISVFTLKTKPVRGLFVLLLTIFFFAGGAVFLFNFAGIWVDMVYPVLVMVLLYLALVLRKYIVEWKSRLVMENELGIAKKIQESFLPKAMPDFKGIEMAAAMFTARQVGGDIYDFCELGKEKLGVMIGDVSGKGVPASLFMAMVAGSFKFFAKLQPKPAEVLFNLNSKLVAESSSNLFVTMFYAIFDVESKVLIYSNGGHLPLIHATPGGDFRFLDSKEGTPLGLMDGQYSEEKVDIREGDLFVFYTDGITEAMNENSELYGAERLEAVIKSRIELTPKEILSAIEKDVRKFEPKSKQHDDITVIVVKI